MQNHVTIGLPQLNKVKHTKALESNTPGELKSDFSQVVKVMRQFLSKLHSNGWARIQMHDGLRD